MGIVQQYEWGNIKWLSDQSQNNVESVDIGITTIHAKKSQERHIHYGDEQYLYTLSGNGITRVDQSEYKLAPGVLIHIPAGACHETYNTMNEDLVELLLSYPKVINEITEQNNTSFKSVENIVDISNRKLTISHEMVKLIETIAESLALPISIYDTEGNCLYSSNQFPIICHKLCKIDEDILNCHFYGRNIFYNSPAYSEQSAYYCKYGLAVINTPILFHQQMIGNIRGGHVLTEDDPDNIHIKVKEHLHNLTNVPKGRLRIILMQYKRLSEYLSHSYQKNLSVIEDIAQNNVLEHDIQLQSLKNDLDLALGRIMNLQINNHFLFNTFNGIASLALDEKANKTYQAIIDLSKLFRYSLKSKQEFVSLKDEIDYIRNYTALQTIRFGNRLSIEIITPPLYDKYYIPLNTLQPIVENSFIHGFKNFDCEMKISIEVEMSDQIIALRIKDNGEGMTLESKNNLIHKLEEFTHERNGLSMVFERLKLFFGREFSFDIISYPNSGTEIVLYVPKRTLYP